MVVPPVPEPASPLSSVLDIVDKVTKVVALLIGGAWAYLNYVRGRTFKKRLELKISAKEVRSNAGLLLSGAAQIKNVGLSKFPIEQKGTAILFFDLRPSTPTDQPTSRPNRMSVFERYSRTMPGLSRGRR